ncbi:MAG: hypothetical protein U0271_05350 [Polyangiaceae bacterium]
MNASATKWVVGCFVAATAVGCGSSAQYESTNYAPRASYRGDAPTQAPASKGGSDDGLATSAPDSGAYRSDGEESRVPAESRPGLGTTWGETRTSRITSSPFARDSSDSPFASAALYYDDEQGAQAMADQLGVRRFDRVSVEIGGGIATLRLKDSSGRFLTGFTNSRKNIVVGEDGDRYSIVIQSHVPARLEVVVSVDGLDVLDGRAATFTKRGYLIDPHGSIEIEGFRQSTEAVAAFRFGAVSDSYAEQKHGDARNVGVIGVALFNERGTNPSSWPIGDVDTRIDADPFPGRFATPP